MSRNKSVNYRKFVHEYIDSDGRTRYAVAEWSETHNQYQRPLDKGDRELTGCNSEFSKNLKYFGGYLTRQKALRRARYLFGQINSLD